MAYKNHAPKVKKAVVGSIVVASAAVVGFVGIDGCGLGETSLDVEFQNGRSVKKLCLPSKEYENTKQTLVDNYDKKGEYSFDINDRNLLAGMINEEMKGKEISFENIETKEQLADELINLLR